MTDAQWSVVRPIIARLRASVMATVVGAFSGVSLFVATAWLVIQGGPINESGEEVVGPHLGLLSNFFPGYSVSWKGAFLGFFYAAVTGAVVAYVTAWVYNTVALRRGSGGSGTRDGAQ